MTVTVVVTLDGSTFPSVLATILVCTAALYIWQSFSTEHKKRQYALSSKFQNDEIPKEAPPPYQPAGGKASSGPGGTNNNKTTSTGTPGANQRIIPPGSAPGTKGSVADALTSSAADLNHESYTVGWICPLDIELAAAKEMLDVVHPALRQVSGDKNTYVLGSMCGHNVTLAGLPAGQTGIASAVTVAENMMRTFPNIRVRLLVGIGGGIPGQKNDVRLGDIVVSHPSGTFGGVVQFDFGKRTADGFERMGYLNSPPQTLLMALQGLKGRHVPSKGSTEIPEYVRRVRDKNPGMADKLVYNSSEDQLFLSEYVHPDKGSSTCEKCDKKKLVNERPQRLHKNPVIHYGLIASSNQIMKNGVERDRVREQFNALCFDTEAAGLMNSFPCLVIRGISSYSDSHANDRWKLYAAMVAAGYAKELLSVLVPGTADAISLIQ